MNEVHEDDNLRCVGLRTVVNDRCFLFCFFFYIHVYLSIAEFTQDFLTWMLFFSSSFVKLVSPQP